MCTITGYVYANILFIVVIALCCTRINIEIAHTQIPSKVNCYSFSNLDFNRAGYTVYGYSVCYVWFDFSSSTVSLQITLENVNCVFLNK